MGPHQWSQDLNFNNLLPICALKQPDGSKKIQQTWETKRTRRPTNVSCRAATDIVAMKSSANPQKMNDTKYCRILGSRFATLAEESDADDANGDDEYPELKEQPKATMPKPKLGAPPKRPQQSFRKGQMNHKKHRDFEQAGNCKTNNVKKCGDEHAAKVCLAAVSEAVTVPDLDENLT